MKYWSRGMLRLKISAALPKHSITRSLQYFFAT
jgi:hypothetical protein